MKLPFWMYAAKRDAKSSTSFSKSSSFTFRFASIVTAACSATALISWSFISFLLGRNRLVTISRVGRGGAFSKEALL